MAGRSPAARLETLNPTTCPKGSQLGSGTTTVDARPLLPDFIRVGSMYIFNTTDYDGKPALGVWAKVFGLTVRNVVDISRDRRGGYGPSFVYGNDPLPGADVGVRVASFELTFPKKSRKVGNRRVSLFEAPRTCRGTWSLQVIDTTYAGKRRHREPPGAVR